MNFYHGLNVSSANRAHIGIGSDGIDALLTYRPSCVACSEIK